MSKDNRLTSEILKTIWLNDLKRECDHIKLIANRLANCPDTSTEDFCEVCRSVRNTLSIAKDLLEELGMVCDYDGVIRDADEEIVIHMDETD